jgi:arylformamidase
VHELAAAGLDGVERLLFRTRNSERPPDAPFTDDFVYIDPEAAQWLGDHGVRLVGIDYLSVERFDSPEPLAHRRLLGAGVVIVEGLDLRGIAPGEYTLACLPIKLADADGAPARAILMAD